VHSSAKKNTESYREVKTYNRIVSTESVLANQKESAAAKIKERKKRNNSVYANKNVLAWKGTIMRNAIAM